LSPLPLHAAPRVPEMQAISDIHLAVGRCMVGPDKVRR
jgi:hypothetical protein